jgi:hypothetical protein
MKNAIHPDLTDPTGPGAPKKKAAAPVDTARLKRDADADFAEYNRARRAAAEGYAPAEQDMKAAFKRGMARDDSLSQARKGKKP